MKQATTIEEQIALLKNRGMFIGDEEKAKEILMDIGYYRLGFYWFPFDGNFATYRLQCACIRLLQFLQFMGMA